MSMLATEESMRLFAAPGLNRSARQHIGRTAETFQHDNGLRFAITLLVPRPRQLHDELVSVDLCGTPQDRPTDRTDARQNVVKHLPRVHGQRTVVADVSA